MTGAPERPRVTILLATRNRAERLAETLEALAGLHPCAFGWEVVVVDNGSSDETATTLRHAASSLPLIHLEELRPGKNRAINLGLAEARGDLIVFTDDDCIPEPDWLVNLVGAADRWPDDNIFGGAVVPRFPGQAPAWLTSPDFRHGRWAFSWYQPRKTEGPTADTPLGPNMMIRARALRGLRFDPTIGPAGSDYAMGSEVELLLRMYRAGEPFIYVPGARVHHVLGRDQLEKTTLMRRAYRCGRGDARLFPGITSFPLFGIPVYQLRRLTEAGVRMLASPVSSQQSRWLAAMDFHQARGHIVEGLALRRAAAAEGAPYQHACPKMEDVVRALRRRGLAAMIVRPLAALIRPLVRRDRIWFFRAESPPRIAEDDDLEIRLYDGSAAGHEMRSALGRLEVLRPERTEVRLSLGHTLAIAFHGSDPIGYNWRAHGSVPITEVDATLHLEPHQVVGYDGYVVPERRGERVIARLDAAQMQAAAAQGRTEQYVYADPANRSSIRSLERMDKAFVFSVSRISIPRLGWSRLLVRGDVAEGRIVPGSELPSP